MDLTCSLWRVSDIVAGRLSAFVCYIVFPAEKSWTQIYAHYYESQLFTFTHIVYICIQTKLHRWGVTSLRINRKPHKHTTSALHFITCNLLLIHSYVHAECIQHSQSARWEIWREMMWESTESSKKESEWVFCRACDDCWVILRHLVKSFWIWHKTINITPDVRVPYSRLQKLLFYVNDALPCHKFEREIIRNVRIIAYFVVWFWFYLHIFFLKNVDAFAQSIGEMKMIEFGEW